MGNDLALKGLREEYAKRTVEGDIGACAGSIHHGIVDATDIMRVSELSGFGETAAGS